MKLLKKIFISLISIMLLSSCGDDDNDSTTTPREVGPVIDEEGNINIRALRQVNPNFSNENLLRNGASAIELLNDEQYTSLTLEIVSVKGFEPTEFGKQTLLDFIDQRLHKPGGVKIVERSIESPGVDSYDVQTVFGQVEAQNRTQFSSGSNLAIFLFFADKDNANSSFTSSMSSVILGTAYLNTSFVIYKRSLQRLAGTNTTALERVEAGTLNHEFCHLLGLVDGPETPDLSDHESEVDGEGDSHCNVPFCLMEANKRRAFDMMGNLEVLQLDPLCIKDLQAIGGK